MARSFIYTCDFCGKEIEDYNPQINKDPDRKITTSIGDKEVELVISAAGDICNECHKIIQDKILTTNELKKDKQ